MAQRPRPAGPPSRRPADALERLYVYWMVSTVVLLLAVVVTILATRAALQRRSLEQNRALIELGQRVAALEGSAGTPPAGPVATHEPAPAQPGPGRPGPTAPTATRPVRPAGGDTRPESPAATQPTVPEADVRARLDRVLTTSPAAAYRVSHPAEAEALLDQATGQIGRAGWSAPTWARLAVLARLLGKDALAEGLAERAHRGGDPLVVFADASARALLAQGRAAEARLHAEYLFEQTDAAPDARLLLAAILLALENPAGADLLLAESPAPAELTLREQLEYARVCLGLQHWGPLAQAVAALPTAVPPELESEALFLRAVALVNAGGEAGRLAEAKGILDYLAEHAAGGRPAEERGGVDLVPRPSEYELATWRGVALLRGQQMDAARQMLTQAAGLLPDRPEAYYWRAILESNAGQPEAARMFLQNALATSAAYAPAWEALGQLALNAGEVEAAIEHLQKAVQANPRRASAHFLLALAHAKAGGRDPAAQALAAALELDPGFLELAQQAEVLTRLFTPEELAGLAAPTTAPADTGEEPR